MEILRRTRRRDRRSEEVLRALWSRSATTCPPPLPRISYADAMRRFGGDKPNHRFTVELVECTDSSSLSFILLSSSAGCVDQGPYHARQGVRAALHTLDGWQGVRQQRTKGLAYVLIGEGWRLTGPVAKNLSGRRARSRAGRPRRRRARRLLSSSPPAPQRMPAHCWGATRIEIAKRLWTWIDPAAWAFTWWWTGRCSRPPTTPPSGDVAVGSGAWTAVHPRSPHPSPARGHLRHRPRQRWPMRTTSCNAAARSAAGPSVSTAATCRAVFAMMGIDQQSRTSSDSCWRRSAPDAAVAARVRLGPDHPLLAGRGLDPW